MMTKTWKARLRFALLPLAALSVSAAVAKPARAPAPAWRSGMAIQMFSFHKDLEKDLPGTLALIKRLGFNQVETFPLANVTPQELRAALDHAGIRAVSSHFGYDRIRDDLPGVIRDAKILGVRQFGPGSIQLFDGKGFRSLTPDHAREAGAVLAKACRAARAAGMRVFIHTHGNEVLPIGESAHPTPGRGLPVRPNTPLDLMSRVANNCFDIEEDIYWVRWAGVDPVAFLHHYGSRVSSLHIKDMGAHALTAGLVPGTIPGRDFPPAGKGILDLRGLFREARAAHVRHYIVEDESDDPASQIPGTLPYLDKIGR